MKPVKDRREWLCCHAPAHVSSPTEPPRYFLRKAPPRISRKLSWHEVRDIRRRALESNLGTWALVRELQREGYPDLSRTALEAVISNKSWVDLEYGRAYEMRTWDRLAANVPRWAFSLPSHILLPLLMLMLWLGAASATPKIIEKKDESLRTEDKWR